MKLTLTVPEPTSTLVPDRWDEALEPANLADDEVDVWRLSLEEDPASWDAMWRRLSGDERQRADRFVFPHDRRRFAIARSALRDLLGRYIELPAERVEFAYGPCGKPQLGGGMAESGWQFNLAHSGEIALVAIARRPVGVDVEARRQGVAATEIVERYFSVREVQEFLSLPAQDCELAFRRCWTRKEAYLKALGSGLSRELCSFCVSLLPGATPALLSDARDDAVGRWRIAELVPAAGYIGAVAVEGVAIEGELRLRRGSWRPDIR